MGAVAFDDRKANIDDGGLHDAAFSAGNQEICSSDLLALGVMTEARARGLSVPKDVAVIGFGDVPFVADMFPSLSTVRINGGDIGTQAANFLIARAEGRIVEPAIVDVGYSIIERDSTQLA